MSRDTYTHHFHQPKRWHLKKCKLQILWRTLKKKKKQQFPVQMEVILSCLLLKLLITTSIILLHFICPDGSVAISQKGKGLTLPMCFLKGLNRMTSASFLQHSHPHLIPCPLMFFGRFCSEASETDGIPLILLTLFDWIDHTLHCLFQLFLYRCFPYLQPIPKKGDSSCPSNYCPVGFLSVLLKVMEKA